MVRGGRKNEYLGGGAEPSPDSFITITSFSRGLLEAGLIQSCKLRKGLDLIDEQFAILKEYITADLKRNN